MGLIPDIAPGARVDLRVEPTPSLSFGLRAAGFPHTSVDASGSHADFFEGLFGLVGCYEVAFGMFGIEGCATFDAGFIGARDPLVPSNGSLAEVLLGGGELGASFFATPALALKLTVSLSGGLRPGDWHVVQGDGTEVVLFRPWPVVVGLGLGISFGTSENRRPSGIIHR
jgi:hypothetical protein